MIEFISCQMSVSTAEEESNYFTGERSRIHHEDPNLAMPAGNYRVINGQLYRIVSIGAPTARTQSNLCDFE